MAAPFVAGLAALIKAKYPYYRVDQIIHRIKVTAEEIDSRNPGFLAGMLGAGRINVHRALGNLSIEIDYPANGSKISKKVLIKGSANIENFSSFKVEYGAGSNPASWLPIGSTHTAPVENSVLESWDATDLLGEHSVKLTVIDSSGESYVTTSNVVISNSSDVDLVGTPLPGPNPFDPVAHQWTKIYYELGSVPAGGADVALCIYDLNGTLIWKRSKHSAGPGVVDDVYWYGESAFGERVGNGVYPFYLVADGKIIGRNKIAVIR
jgi:hypothetical protein